MWGSFHKPLQGSLLNNQLLRPVFIGALTPSKVAWISPRLKRPRSFPREIRKPWQTLRQKWFPRPQDGRVFGRILRPCFFPSKSEVTNLSFQCFQLKSGKSERNSSPKWRHFSKLPKAHVLSVKRALVFCFFDDGEEKGMICKEMEGHSDDILYRGIADEIWYHIQIYTQYACYFNRRILKTNTPTSMNHLDGSQRSPWCKFPLRSSEKAWIHPTFSRMIHWRLFPWKTNMSPENQWLEDVLPTEIVPRIRGHVSFPGVYHWKGWFFSPGNLE